MDTRSKLADVLVHYSCNIKYERVLISYDGDSAKPLVKQLIKEVYASAVILCGNSRFFHYPKFCWVQRRTAGIHERISASPDGECRHISASGLR